MSHHVCLALILLPIILLYAGLTAGVPLPIPGPQLNLLLSLLNPGSLVNSSTALNPLALTHLDHQLGSLSALGDVLGAGLNFTDSILG